MTTVSYIVGNEGTTSYAKALAIQERTGQAIIRHYERIPETPELSEEAKALRDKRVAKRKERMGWA